jgi:hypothetical protein
MRRLLTPLFAATLFLGSSLMFLLEPMVGRMALPSLGGAPSVWNGCVLFFQVCLLAGYACAHGLGGLPLLAQAGTYASILLLGFIGLPLEAQLATGAPEGPPSLWLFWSLTTWIGLPSLASLSAHRSCSAGFHKRATMRPTIPTSCTRQATPAVSSR